MFILFLVSLPPTLIQQADSEIIFDPRMTLELPCLANGDPTPVYTWTKNGQIYDLYSQNESVVMASDSGNLIFTEPQTIDQG